MSIAHFLWPLVPYLAVNIMWWSALRTVTRRSSPNPLADSNARLARTPRTFSSVFSSTSSQRPTERSAAESFGGKSLGPMSYHPTNNLGVKTKEIDRENGIFSSKTPLRPIPTSEQGDATSADAARLLARVGNLGPHTMKSASSTPNLGTIPKSSSRDVLFPSPSSRRPLTSSLSSSGSTRLLKAAPPPVDVPGEHGVWSPFNVRSQSWGSCGLLAIAREQHASTDRLKHELASQPRLSTSSSAQRLHSQMTENRARLQWPRGTLPANELLPRRRAPTSSHTVAPAGASYKYRQPADQLYARHLFPAKYGWSGAGGPPGSARKGMVFL